MPEIDFITQSSGCPMDDIIVIGIAGGSGSGKTTMSKILEDKLGTQNCSILYQDSYYIDQSDKFDFDGGSVNFDHPKALDFVLMAKHIELLKANQPINVPIYDFENHKRLFQTSKFMPTKIVIIDGTMILSQEVILNKLNHKIYIDCEEIIRFERRLERDVRERGRTPEGVKKQFYSQVKPMHDQYVEPSRHEACEVIRKENFSERVDYWCDKLSLALI